MFCLVSERVYSLRSGTVSMHCLSALWVTLWQTTGLFCLCWGRGAEGKEPLLSVYDSLSATVVVMSPCWKYANCLCVLVLCSSPWQVTMVPSVAPPEQLLSLSLLDQHSHCAFRLYTLSAAIADTKRQTREIHASPRQRHSCTATHLYTCPLHTRSFLCEQFSSATNKHKHYQVCME